MPIFSLPEVGSNFALKVRCPRGSIGNKKQQGSVQWCYDWNGQKVRCRKFARKYTWQRNNLNQTYLKVKRNRGSLGIYDTLLSFFISFLSIVYPIFISSGSTHQAMAGGILNYAENYPLQVFKMYGGILSKVRSNLKKMIGVVFHKFGEKTIIKQRR